MSLISEILNYNESFVESKEYEQYLTTKFPDKRMVILTCMDTRLVELLPKAMNLRNGDSKIIKTPALLSPTLSEVLCGALSWPYMNWTPMKYS